jgi:hypothetical protein
MGIRRENGYSASVAAYLTVGGQRVQIAKMNRDYLTLADTCELASGTEAQVSIIIDEKKSTKMILLNDGVVAGQREVRYSVLARSKIIRHLATNRRHNFASKFLHRATQPLFEV